MRVLELFAGAGGLAKGLELAGFQHVALVEKNKHACASLAANFDPQKVFAGDVNDFDLRSVGAVEVVAGGPPCQPFSLGGKHKADEDARDMFPAAIRAIEVLQPQAFLFENVKGILRPGFADYFEYILLRLTYPSIPLQAGHHWREHLAILNQAKNRKCPDISYRVSYALINAADYGVPQQRERVLIVGLRSDMNTSFAFPQATHSQARLLWDMYVSDAYWRRHHIDPYLMDGVTPAMVAQLRAQAGLFAPASAPWQTIRDALQGVPPPQSDHGIPDHTYRDGARSYPGHTGSSVDWPAKTIKAGDHGVPGGENMIRYTDGQVRYFTVLEAKRIQTFPDDFVIHGAWGEAMRQIGNAVPVQLAHALGAHLAHTLRALAPPRVVARLTASV